MMKSAVVGLSAGIAALFLVACISIHSLDGGSRSIQSELLGERNARLQLDPKKMMGYPNAMKTLAGAAAYEITSLNKGSYLSSNDLSSGRRTQTLTTDPYVAEYMFNNENGNWDGTVGPDKGWIPYGENEPCQDGICYEQYAKTLRSNGLGGIKRARMPRFLHQGMLSQASSRGRVPAVVAERLRASMRGVHQGRLGAFKQTGRGRLSSLADIDDFPDIADNVEVNDAADTVKKIYRPFAPLGSEENQPDNDTEDYANFYRAYSAYQLPHQVSNWHRNWVPSIDSLGKARLPPHAYPYSDAYYPSPSKAAITINANGAYSSNSFTVHGPQSIAVNIGNTGVAGAGNDGAAATAGAGAQDGFVYPDGKTAVPSNAKIPTERVVGGATATSGDGQVYGAECGPSNPDCSFWQDAYDDAYY